MSTTAVAGNSPVTTGLSVSYSEEGLGMLPFRPTAPQELSEGYQTAADLARDRKCVVESWGDKAEAKQWAKVETYCRMMVQAKMVEAPDSLVDYAPKEIPMDPHEVQRRIADEVAQESEWGLDIDERLDPRRPMEKWKRMTVAAAMSALSPKERVIAQMHFGWMLPRQIIAESLHISEQTVHVHLAAAKKKFGKMRLLEEKL